MPFFKEILKKIKWLIRYINLVVNKIMRFISYDIWHLDSSDFSRWKRRLVRNAKILLLMLNTFSVQKIGIHAIALSYQCVMSIVPMIAIIIYLSSGFHIYDTLYNFLTANLSNDQLIGDIMNAADTIITTAESGLFGFISMISFIWIVIWMMLCVIKAFNEVWKTKESRNIFRQIGIVLIILILSPIVLLLFFSGSAVYYNIIDLLLPSTGGVATWIKSFVGWLLFAAIAIGMFTVIYKYIPACKVKARYAFNGALFSGIAFTVVQYLYIETQMMVAKQNAVYGALAAIPLIMIWMSWGWRIILYGAELSYAYQNIDAYDLSNDDIDSMRKSTFKERKRYSDTDEMFRDAGKNLTH